MVHSEPGQHIPVSSSTLLLSTSFYSFPSSKIDLTSSESHFSDIDFDETQVCAAQYGGPVALIKSPQQMIRGPGTEIKMYTATGQPRAKFEWNSGSLLKMGWSDTEELICVQEDGIVLRYNMFGDYQHKFSMGQEVKDTKVIDARIFASSFGTGVAVMTTKFRISLVNSVTVPKCQQLAEMTSSSEFRRINRLLCFLFLIFLLLFQSPFPPGGRLWPPNGAPLRLWLVAGRSTNCRRGNRCACHR